MRIPTPRDAGQLPSFNAYSADGDVTADLVYVNYGIPEDYEQLAKLGVDVKGKIVDCPLRPQLARDQAEGRAGSTARSAASSTPIPRRRLLSGDVFPTGAFRPEQGVQRGSVMDMPIYPGDPLTPGWALRGGRQEARSREESKTLLKIPVLPISYGDALPLLRSLRARSRRKPGAGRCRSRITSGPGASKVHMKLAFDWRERPLYNVIARIPGAQYPDEWIIHGNHHDAWVNGASDPTSGNVALMETARGLAELVKTGWKPKRTIVIASWDGEEWGLLGSTEWVEKHQDGAGHEGGRLHQQRRHRQRLAGDGAARTRCRRSSTRSRATCPTRAAPARACSKRSVSGS